MERPAAQAAQAACVSCVNESEAYQRLFEGDARRHFERLPRNPETSRGHVFFQLHLKKQSETKEAVLSFVDLAAGAQGAQCLRNQATESIESSLQELRQLARSALCGGLPEPLPEPGLLCSLLLPWLRPGGLSLPSLVTLLPLRWQKQSGSEIYDFLQLVRILHQAAKSRSPQRNGAGPPIPRSPQSQEEASREADTANSPSDALTTWSPWSAVVVHSQKAEEALEAEEPAEAEVGPRPVPMKSELPDPPPLGPRPTGLDPLGQLLGRLPTPLRLGGPRGPPPPPPPPLQPPAELSEPPCAGASASAASTPIRRPSVITLPRRVSLTATSQRTMLPVQAPSDVGYSLPGGFEPPGQCTVRCAVSRSPSPWQMAAAPQLRPRSCDTWRAVGSRAAGSAPPWAAPAPAPTPSCALPALGPWAPLERTAPSHGTAAAAVPAVAVGIPVPFSLAYPCYSSGTSVPSYSPVPMRRYPWSLGAAGGRSRSSSPCPRPGAGAASLPLHRTGSVPRVPLVARSWIPAGPQTAGPARLTNPEQA